MVSSLFTAKLTSLQIDLVNNIVCKPLGLPLNAVLGVMYFETAGSLSTTKTNSIGSVGLLQFTRDNVNVNYKTINGKRFLLSEIKAMTFENQLRLCYLYLKPYAAKIQSYTDLYLAVFFPLAIGKDDNYVLQTSNLSAAIIAAQNPIFDVIKDGKLIKSEVTNYFANYFNSNFSLINFTQKKNQIMQYLKNFMLNYPILAATTFVGFGILIYHFFICKKR